MMQDTAQAKQAAATAAADQVHDGMVLGLGTGSTAALFVAEIGRRYQSGRLKNLLGAATSDATAAQAEAFGLPLAPSDDCPAIDLAVDGADEVDPQLNLLKGRGGALLREKIIASNARKFLVIVDGTKIVTRLGMIGPLAVEVVSYGWKSTARWLEHYGAPTLRERQGKPFLTDNGNYVLDVAFASGIGEAARLAAELDRRPGVVEHGIFMQMATTILIGGTDGVQLLGEPMQNG